MVGKSILLPSIAGSSLNVSITTVLEDKGGQRVGGDNPENGDGGRLNGQDSSLLLLLHLPHAGL